MARSDWTPLARQFQEGLLSRIFHGEPYRDFVADYARHDLLRGQTLQVSGAPGRFEGVGAGVDARGALQVRMSDGRLRRIDSADVTVRRT